jgi:hypothetical protein
MNISGGLVNNVNGKDITISGNWTDNIASGGFVSSAGKVTFNGSSAQTITTNVNEKFYNLEINNSNGLTLQSPVEVTNNLILTSGKINTSASKELTLSNSNSNIVSGVGLGTTSFINGPLNKNIGATGSFTFPIGTGNTYGPATLTNTDADVWQAQYYLADYNSTLFIDPVVEVSNLEYWRIKSASGSKMASITLPYGASGIVSKWVLTEYSNITSKWNNDLGSTISTLNSTVTSNIQASFNLFSTGNFYSVGSTNLISWIGGVSTNWFDPNNWSTVSVPTLSDNVKIPVVNTIDHFYPNINLAGAVCRNITIQSGTPSALLTITNPFNLDIYGNWTNNGTFTAIANSSVTFKGSLSQTIGGTLSTTFSNLTINNNGVSGSNVITLNQPTFVSGAFTPTDGIINTTTINILTLNSGATSAIGSANSFVNGPMIFNMANSGTSTLNFPIGKGSVWRPFVLTPTHSDATSVDYTGEVINSSAMAFGYALPATIANVSYVRYWQIDRQNVANLTSSTIQLYYGTDDVVTNLSNLAVAKTSGSVAPWIDLGGSNQLDGGGTPTGYVLSGSFNSFSKFSLANKSGGSNPLPIELLEFTANKNNSVVDLKWVTSAEINNDYFTIDKTTNGTEFETVTVVKGAGNSSNTLNYSTVDNNPYQGISYYRLKQTDFDGKFTYSKLVAVDFTVTSNSLSFEVFPNPISQNEGTNIRIKEFQPEAEILVVVRDLLGQELYSKVIMTDFSGNSITAIDIENRLPAGTYLIIGTSLNHTFNKYLIIK